MSNQYTNDQELLQLLCTKSSEAFNIIYDRYWMKLYRVSNKILEDEELAKDVVQEAFVSLYEKASEKPIQNLQAYLIQTVKYLCFMQLRSGKISEKHLHRINQIEALNVVENEYDAKELELILDKGIASLPQKCREVFFLSRYEYLSNKKIAAQLNISQKTVEHQITKALKVIRLSLDKFAVIAMLCFLM
jgi:RNA polymerase sigma-70 factor (ECF subfamily)